jgi:hypothetical protein
MSLTNLEKQLDKAFQRLAIGKQCHFCNSPATEIHHLEPRANKLYRYDQRNALPICRKHHFDLHNGDLKNPTIDLPRIGLKDYLLRNGLIYKEFLELKKEELGI